MKTPIKFVEVSRERLEVLLSNLLYEVYDKTFDDNFEEFEKYCKLEIGFSDDEVSILEKSTRKLPGDEFLDIDNDPYIDKDIVSTGINICDFCANNTPDGKNIDACRNCNANKEED